MRSTHHLKILKNGFEIIGKAFKFNSLALILVERNDEVVKRYNKKLSNNH